MLLRPQDMRKRFGAIWKKRYLSADKCCRLSRAPIATSVVTLLSILFLYIHSSAMYTWSMIEKELLARSTEPLILSLLAKGTVSSAVLGDLWKGEYV